MKPYVISCFFSYPCEVCQLRPYSVLFNTFTERIVLFNTHCECQSVCYITFESLLPPPTLLQSVAFVKWFTLIFLALFQQAEWSVFDKSNTLALATRQPRPLIGNWHLQGFPSSRAALHDSNPVEQTVWMYSVLPIVHNLCANTEMSGVPAHKYHEIRYKVL